MHMIGGAVDQQWSAADFANDAANVGKEPGLELRVQQGHAILR
jgi:hypothetical protein